MIVGTIPSIFIPVVIGGAKVSALALPPASSIIPQFSSHIFSLSPPTKMQNHQNSSNLFFWPFCYISNTDIFIASVHIFSTPIQLLMFGNDRTPLLFSPFIFLVYPPLICSHAAIS